mgnify:CR=1 FL=1
MTNNKEYHIGLVMAGEVSAGAYTAGVIDFLLEALEEWEKEKKCNPEAPKHQVCIKVLAGASAGGITAALTFATLDKKVVPVRKADVCTQVSNNMFYNCWVEKAELDSFLQTSDLRETNKVRSLLNSKGVQDIADYVFQDTDEPTAEGEKLKNQPYISTDLEAFLSLTNLRGVPYAINQFAGASGKSHEVSMHADYMHFKIGKDVKAATMIDFNQPKTAANWQQLKNAAIATGAFPIGLAPVLLERPKADYNNRSWKIDAETVRDVEKMYEQDATTTNNIIPNWPKNTNDSKINNQYRFLCVDGGLMNNEPLELARQALRLHQKEEGTDPKSVNYSTILIDPFPTSVNYPKDEVYEGDGDDVISIVAEMFKSLRNQTLFKPEELRAAYSKNDYNRYLIAPTRRNPETHTLFETPLASGFLDGFGGFLNKSFRLHDYMLGRKNCQGFLRDHFNIPEEDARLNPIFLDSVDSTPRSRRAPMNVPIIPLYGTAIEKVELPDWPSYGANDLALLKNKIGKRVEAIIYHMLVDQLDVNKLLSKYIERENKGRWMQSLRSRFLHYLSDKFVVHSVKMLKGKGTDKVIKIIENELVRAGLLVKPTADADDC